MPWLNTAVHRRIEHSSASERVGVEFCKTFFGTFAIGIWSKRSFIFGRYLTIIPRARMGSESIAHEAEGGMGY